MREASNRRGYLYSSPKRNKGGARQDMLADAASVEMGDREEAIPYRDESL